MLWPALSRASLALFAVVALCPLAASSAQSERVSGYFCGAMREQIAFLRQTAAGESEEIAANDVNKAIGKQTCAYFMPADALPMSDKTVVNDGVVYKMQSYLFLPEKVERWTGTFFGVMQAPPKTFSTL